MIDGWSDADVPFASRLPSKSQRHGALGAVNLKKLISNKRICPVACLQYHAGVTKQLRQDEAAKNLFVCSKWRWDARQRQ